MRLLLHGIAYTWRRGAHGHCGRAPQGRAPRCARSARATPRGNLVGRRTDAERGVSDSRSADGAAENAATPEVPHASTHAAHAVPTDECIPPLSVWGFPRTLLGWAVHELSLSITTSGSGVRRGVDVVQVRRRQSGAETAGAARV